MTDSKTPGQDTSTPSGAGETEPAPAAKTGESGKADSAETTEQTLREENTALKDRLLRLMAEMENLRRRTDREKGDAGRYAITSFAKDLVNVGDNLSRALDALDEKARNDADENIRNLIAGVEMTERELLNVFGRHGIEKIEPKGERFDPNFHQAMFKVDDAAVEADTVLEVMQPGYLIGERVVRPAMVSVAKGGPRAKAPPAPGAGAAGDNATASGKPARSNASKSRTTNAKSDTGVGGKIDKNA